MSGNNVNGHYFQNSLPFLFILFSIVDVYHIAPVGIKMSSQGTSIAVPILQESDFIFIFRQHAASIYGFVTLRYVALRYVKKKFQATSKQGRRLRFGMLTVVTNIRSTKVLLAMPHSDILAWLSSATLKNFISGVSTRILML